MNAPRCPVHVNRKMKMLPEITQVFYGRVKLENVLRFKCPVKSCVCVAAIEKEIR
jgi:hypothetical protein